MTSVESIVEILARGPAARRELQAAIGSSQPTLARLLARLGGRLVRMGRARATRYALLRPIRELREIPVHRVDTEGRIRLIGRIHPVQPEGLWFEDLERDTGALFPGLPWFIADMRPQGFLGRLFAHRCRDRGLPERLSDWTDNHVLYALATLGEDQPGNLVLGEGSHERWQGMQREGPRVFPPAARGTQFRELAAAVLAGEPPGSSAGGEQQKFGAAIEENGVVRHYIVKFSPPYGEALGRRWADLLVWESLARDAIREAGIPAAETQLFDDGERMYLQVRRFDRVGAQGRRGVVSFAALDDAFVGERNSWSGTAERLARLGWITAEDALRAAWLEGFGRLIGNTDMHFGNLSVLHDGPRPLALSPAYDMLPMAYAPRATGEMSHAILELSALPSRAHPHAASILGAAARFWQAASNDPRVSAQGRQLAAGNADAIARVLDRTAPAVVADKSQG
ncbi:MAG: type II toxin-antitoxin system HipA family toxin YjjJ [Gammaproteobacteria bacterium]